jgi:3',5'-cyclic AMP phosphodiesterase CpdA
VGLAAAATALTVLAPSPVGPAEAAPTGVHVVAVGDIAREGGGQARTAAMVAARDPRHLLLLGDLTYPDGSIADFATWFDPAYGRFLPRTWAVPGNHEYRTPGAAGYRTYLGVTGPTWWLRRTGAWSVIGLDSEQVSSIAQQRFLAASLRSENGRPTVVVWHRPRFSSGRHGDQRDTQVLYGVAARDRDVRLVLWGHDHHYERLSLANGRLTGFVVGTGGATPYRVSRPYRPSTRTVVSGRYGVLDLWLRPRGFTFRFTTGDGVVRDSGTRSW